MSFMECIGDGLLYAFSFLFFIGIASLAWLSTYVHLPTTLFLIERQIYQRNIVVVEEEEEEESLNFNSHNEQSPSSDIESSEIDEFPSEQSFILSEPIIHQIQTTSSEEQEHQLLRITIKFLNETQKLILANSNDTISKIKRLYFADELSNNKIIRFIYQGQELQDSETLRTYNIRDQTIIHCQISIRRHSTPNRINNGFDTSSFLDVSPINISFQFIIFFILILGSIWYLRIKYRVLFTSISTIILLLITILFLIFTCGPLLTTRRQISHQVHFD